MLTLPVRVSKWPCVSSFQPIAFCRRGLRASVLVLFAVMLAFGGAVSAEAQAAAYFSGASPITLGGGFSGAVGVAVDASGNVYVADNGNGTVDKIPASCISGSNNSSCVNTLYTTGLIVPQGIAVDGSGNVYFTIPNSNVVREIKASDGSTVELGNGFFDQPYGVAVDSSGNVYVADTDNNAVKEIVAASGSIMSLGSGFYQPYGVAVDGNGNVYVADSNNSAVEEIPASCISGNNNSTCMLTLGSGFNQPSGVAVDGNGNVYVADTNNSAVKEIVAASGSVETLGNGFVQPFGVSVDGSGNVYVAVSNTAYGGSSVQKIPLGGINFGSAAVKTTTPAQQTLNFTFSAAGTINAPAVLTQGAPNLDFTDAGTGTCTTNGTSHSYSVDDSCTVIVNFTPQYAGQRNGAVVIADSSGNVLATAYVSGTGTGPQVGFPSNSAVTTLPGVSGGYSRPSGIAVDGNGNVYVADYGNRAVYEIVAVNGVVSSNVSTIGHGFSYPQGVAVDGSGNVYVADTGNSAVYEIVAVNGVVSSSSTVNPIGSGFNQPYGVAVDARGNVFVADNGSTSGGAGAVYEIVAVNGVVSSSSTVNPIGSGFNGPIGVAVDTNGNVYVADANNSAMKEIVAVNGVVSSTSTINTIGSGFSEPDGVAVDGSGNVYVADFKNSAVYEIVAVNGVVSSTSTINTIGSGFSAPSGVEVDAKGNVFVTDYHNNAAYEIDRSDAPSLSFASTALDETSSDSPQTVTLQNIGNEPLTITSGPVISTDSSDFTLDSSTTCSSSAALAAGATCTLAADFSPTTATGLLSGALSLTDNALNQTAATQTITLSGTATGADTNTEVSANLSDVNYGTSITFTANVTSNNGTPTGSVQFAVDSVNSGSAVALSSGYAIFTTSTLTAGEHTITATYLASTGYATSSGSVSVTVNAVTPTITWATPTAIPYGTALSATQLDATATVAGTFSYSPALGTLLTAGTHSLMVTFKPTDTTDYTTTIATVNITVNQAAPTLSWTAPAAIPYGTALTATQLDATASVAGKFTYTPAAGTVLKAGANQTLSATFVPTDTTDYATPTAPVTTTITVTPVLATITTAPTTTAITYGQPLSSATLSAGAVTVNGTAVAGSFRWTEPQSVPSAGMHTEAVVFTPTDTTDYQQVTGSATVTVNKATPTVTAPVASGITYGQTLAASTLTSGSATFNGGTAVAGKFTWAAAGAAPAAGTQTEAVTFTPNDTTDFATPAAVNVSISVAKAALTVAPASVSRAYAAANPTLTGTVTGLVNGDTAASVGVVYSTTATTTSAAGTYPITATITSANYALTVTPGVLTVTDDALTVAANNASKVYGTANPALTGTMTGAKDGDSFTASYTTTATIASPVGSYAIVPSVTGANLGDYSVTKTNGTLTVTQATSAVSISASATSITPAQGVTLTATATDATAGSVGTPTGTVSFYNGTALLGSATLTNGVATLTLAAGTLAAGATDVLSATYAGDGNFVGSSATTSVTVATAVALDFTLTPPTSTTFVVFPGSSYATSFTIAPLHGSYAGTVNFSASGLPAGATATFSPATLNASTSAAQTVTMTVQLPQSTAKNTPQNPWRTATPAALALVLLPFAAMRRLRRSLWMVLALAVGLGGMLSFTGCISTRSFSSAAPESYTVTVTATAGSFTHSFQTNLNVQ